MRSSLGNDGYVLRIGGLDWLGGRDDSGFTLLLLQTLSENESGFRVNRGRGRDSDWKGGSRLTGIDGDGHLDSGPDNVSDGVHNQLTL